MSPALTEVQRRSNAIEIRDGITLDFYTGLPHLNHSQIHCISVQLLVLTEMLYACASLSSQILTFLEGELRTRSCLLETRRNQQSRLNRYYIIVTLMCDRIACTKGSSGVCTTLALLGPKWQAILNWACSVVRLYVMWSHTQAAHQSSLGMRLECNDTLLTL